MIQDRGSRILRTPPGYMRPSQEQHASTLERSREKTSISHLLPSNTKDTRKLTKSGTLGSKVRSQRPEDIKNVVNAIKQNAKHHPSTFSVSQNTSPALKAAKVGLEPSPFDD